MYEVWFTNFGYLADEVFDTLDEAVKFGLDKGFEFSVFCDNDMVAYASGVTLSVKVV